MNKREEQAQSYAMALNDAVSDKLKTNGKKPSGYFHGRDIERAFLAGWDAALKNLWHDASK